MRRLYTRSTKDGHMVPITVTWRVTWHLLDSQFYFGKSSWCSVTASTSAFWQRYLLLRMNPLVPL